MSEIFARKSRPRDVARAGLGERIDKRADHREGGDLSISAGRITFRGTVRRILPQARGFRLSSVGSPEDLVEPPEGVRYEPHS